MAVTASARKGESRGVRRLDVAGESRGGFTILEVITAMFILSIGLISMLALFSSALGTMQYAQDDLICKQKAKEAIESIFTARESAQIGFSNINNTTTSGGVFLPGFTSLTTAGPDGLVNTSDDGAVEQMRFPGPSGYLQFNSSDLLISLNNFQRQISITPLMNGTIANPDIRQLAVTVEYTNPNGDIRSYTINTLISRYR